MSDHLIKNVLIVGAGGVASHLIAALIKGFRPEGIILVDKDKLEARNLDRQLFNEAQIGMNKAMALVDLHKEAFRNAECSISFLDQWFSTSSSIPNEEDLEVIICVADNHKARRDALARADALDIPCFIGGNEYLDSEAYVYLPAWKGTQRDPRVRYPAIVTSEEGSPLSCQGEEQVSSPQLAIANFGCAAKILQLMWSWLIWPKTEAEVYQFAKDTTLSYELQSNGFGSTSVCHEPRI